MRERCRAFLQELQNSICAALEDVDGGCFRADTWERAGGGGGASRVLSDGGVLEKAGVNFSEGHGALEGNLSGDLPGEGSDFYATGISLVLHPRNPKAPTVHSNLRYIERGDKKWF
ncbi:MAG: coproporphyrinogen III oxidase, partial [Planctomycetes bacterium]|nr:coproporphyrinogen III oxidase [Planctomycetota bacterium]